MFLAHFTTKQKNYTLFLVYYHFREENFILSTFYLRTNLIRCRYTMCNKNIILEKYNLEMTFCYLGCEFSEKPMTYLKSTPLNYVNLKCHTHIEKSQLYRVSQGFCMTYRVTLRKRLPMDDFKNGQNPSR